MTEGNLQMLPYLNENVCIYQQVKTALYFRVHLYLELAVVALFYWDPNRGDFQILPCLGM